MCFSLVVAGPRSSCGAWLLIPVASLIAEHRLQGVWASVVVAHVLSCTRACGVPGPGTESVSPALAGRFFFFSLGG